MRTTVRLNDSLLEKAKAEARRRHQTLTSLIEEGLHRVLAEARSGKRRRKVILPVSSASGGLLPGVDLEDRGAILDIMDGIR
jgi:hypothetical protein